MNNTEIAKQELKNILTGMAKYYDEETSPELVQWSLYHWTRHFSKKHNVSIDIEHTEQLWKALLDEGSLVDKRKLIFGKDKGKSK